MSDESPAPVTASPDPGGAETVKPEHPEPAKPSCQAAPNDVFLLIASGFGICEQEPESAPEPVRNDASSIVTATQEQSQSSEPVAETVAEPIAAEQPAVPILEAAPADTAAVETLALPSVDPAPPLEVAPGPSVAVDYLAAMQEQSQEPVAETVAVTLAVEQPTVPDLEAPLAEIAAVETAPSCMAEMPYVPPAPPPEIVTEIVAAVADVTVMQEQSPEPITTAFADEIARPLPMASVAPPENVAEVLVDEVAPAEAPSGETEPSPLPMDTMEWPIVSAPYASETVPEPVVEALLDEAVPVETPPVETPTDTADWPVVSTEPPQETVPETVAEAHVEEPVSVEALPVASEMPAVRVPPSQEVVFEATPPIDEETDFEEMPEEEVSDEGLSEDDIEAIVGDFRAWLSEAKEIPPAPPEPDFDLATVVQHFTALRQEVNLQTRASRSLLEQNTQTSDLLRKSLETTREQYAQLQEFDSDVQDEVIRPMLKTLVDAHDALSLARREMQRQLDNLGKLFQAAERPAPTILPAPPAPPSIPQAPVVSQPAITGEPPMPPPIHVTLPSWARWFGLESSIEQQLDPVRAWAETSRRWHQAAQLWHAAFPAWHEAILAWHETARAWQQETQAWYETAQGWHAEHVKKENLPPPEDPSPRFRQLLDALLVGYQMSSQRIERALKGQGLETIPCLGLPFDPETMEVVEVVREEGRTGTQVLEVVRNGYLWKDRVFRCAQVRVAKP